MGRFDLVIFDCDGVLVDSERLAIRTEAEVLFHLGWPLTESEIVERFVGRSASSMHEAIEEHLGRPVDWEAEFEARYEEVFAHELLPVPGVAEVVRQITVPMCVASSGSQEKMRFTLGITGLLDVFGERLFSVDEVENGKPAPDIFLYASEKMGVKPDRCAVVEDSVLGVMAGLASEMTVFAFSGGVTNAARLSIGSAIVFDDMHMLPALLSAD